MLPTKGYFQDIECPYYDSSCGRPYCHFRHRKKATETIDEIASEPEKEATAPVPTYKPTPKSELANIQNSKSHIPISYVPDFKPDRKSRPLLKFEKPTYKPTPLSILSSANKRRISEGSQEHIEAIKEIKQNIANVEYNPAVSLQSTADIDFEDLSTEFDLIDEIINSTEKVQRKPPSVEVKSVPTSNSSVVNKLSTQCDSSVIKESGVKLQGVGEEYDPSEVSNKDVQKCEKSNDKKEQKCETFSEKSSKDNSKEKSGSKHSKSNKSSRRSSQEHSTKHDKSEKSKSQQEKDKNEKLKISERIGHSDKEKLRKLKDESGKEKSKKSSDKSEVKSHNSSSSGSKKEKHRREEKKEKHSHHKSKHSSRDRSRSRSKEKNSHKTSEKEKEKRLQKDKKNCEKSNEKHKAKSKHASTHSEKQRSSKERSSVKKEEKPIPIEDSSDDNDGYIPLTQDDIQTNFSDLDLDFEDDEDETMLECYKIFNEYKPPEKSNIETPFESKIAEADSSQGSSVADAFGKKRVAHSNVENTITYSQLHPPSKPKALSNPGQVLTNRYKIAKLAQANREQECIINEVRQPAVSAKRPAPTLLEAAREHKLRKQSHQATISSTTSLVDDIIKGVAKPSTAQTKIHVKKIAPAQNVQLIQKAKERISKIKQTTQIKTIAQTQKSNRIAHIPEVSLSDIPDVLQAEKSKLPVNVRTRFLTMIADECIKLYMSKEEAYSRALNEEFSCYEKCKVLATYRNSAMLAVNRLRKEIQERDRLGLGLIGFGEGSHKDPSAELRGNSFYNKVKKWVLTDEELDIHGYPRESEEHYGHAVIKNRRNMVRSNIDENQKICSRCHKIYQVDDDGWPLFEEECLYHPLKKRTIRGEQTYLCCRSSDDIGCVTSDTHVSDSSSEAELEGFQKTMDPEYEDDPRSHAVYALDCEMCYTTKGLELTRVTIVDTDCKTVYESLVKPLNPIIDYNTRFSGITKEQMDKTSTSILQVQANILHLCNSRTILVGHSLESDMKVLKIMHGTIIDTSVLFPHKMGLPHKRALKALASEYLRKIIQNDISGHDSAEDAVTCMELIKWKLKDELKSRGSK
ncbi:hypothetical protein NQ315_000802 [Exocentrus adspersus]|uniref:Exonuclease domain-containing protein n=1 Tax=Exocentrus adspersus TaxID=1586481 RepID=A0AAV8WEH4_9CUCU|nr:hypothetical protein NQ315_000802 [Exocentrus adspersus]